MMKQISLAAAGLILLAHSAFSQKPFDGIGEKGAYNSSVKGATAFYVPQLSIGFETYVETKVVVQEGKLSKMQNTFGAASKGKTYTGQSGSAKTTTILDAGLELADFQELANEFQAMLDSEIEKAGFKVLRMSEMDKYPSFAKVAEKYSTKTEQKQGKASAEDIGAAKVQVYPANTLFMFNENSVMRGGGPAFYGMMKKVHSETGAVMILQNLDIDFSTVELDVELDAGQKGKTTKADTKVLPKMRITYNAFDFIGPKGGPNSVPGRMVSEMVSEKSY